MQGNCWKETINGKPVQIISKDIHSNRKDQKVREVHVVTSDSDRPYILRIVIKSSRRRKESNFNTGKTVPLPNELFFLIQEVSVRTQYFHPGLCQLLAVRDNENYTFLFEEYCEMGNCMKEDGDQFHRVDKSFKLRDIVARSGHAGAGELPVLQNTFSEAEACYIMWQVLHTLQDLHNNLLAHLDVRPDNIYITSSGEVKLGGLYYIFNFKDDRFGGLRSNLPGRKDFLLREYWKGGLNSPIASDIWAACLTLYILVTGTHPYYITDFGQPLCNSGFFQNLPDMTMLSADLRSLLTLCFDPPRQAPLTIRQILTHRWFKAYGYCDDVQELQRSNSVAITKPRVYANDVVFENWVSSSVEAQCSIFDVCFNNILNITYGIANDSAEDLLATSWYDNSQPAFATVANQITTPLATIQRAMQSKVDDDTDDDIGSTTVLPRRGTVKYRDTGSCWWCWKTTELYVEAGTMRVGIENTKDAQKFSTSAIIFEFDSHPKCFNVIVPNHPVLRFKVNSEEEVKAWNKAIMISNSIALSRS